MYLLMAAQAYHAAFFQAREFLGSSIHFFTERLRLPGTSGKSASNSGE
jgi:hypothetical protein